MRVFSSTQKQSLHIPCKRKLCHPINHFFKSLPSSSVHRVPRALSTTLQMQHPSATHKKPSEQSRLLCTPHPGNFNMNSEASQWRPCLKPRCYQRFLCTTAPIGGIHHLALRKQIQSIGVVPSNCTQRYYIRMRTPRKPYSSRLLLRHRCMHLRACTLPAYILQSALRNAFCLESPNSS